jgi:NTE family protein
VTRGADEGDARSDKSGNGGDVPATRQELEIGLALSGGGMRAAVFHLGVLGRLAAEGVLENVEFVSTVSGGSLGIGLVYTIAGNRWPASEEYLGAVVPEAKRLLTTVDIQRAAQIRLLGRPWRLLSRGWANVLAEVLRREWGVRGRVNEVPPSPRWIINATSYESGKNWRFAPLRMGDYLTGHVFDPPVPVAEAMAASAGYPMLIGFLVLETGDYEWERYLEGSTSETEPTDAGLRRVHLWDGGVYDNLGVEALFKPGRQRRLREGCNFLVVSDASSALGPERRYRLYRQARRLLSIAMDQVRSLRARMIFDHFFAAPGSGIYLMMGRSAETTLREAGLSTSEIGAIASGCLPDEEVEQAALFPTTLRRVKEGDFDRLYRHGWEAADCNLRTCRPDLFAPVPACRRSLK